MRLAQLLTNARREGWGEWIRSQQDERAVQEGCRFDVRAAERVRTFFEKFLRHSKGQWAGHPFQLLDWQWREIVAPLFGWKRADGSRRYRRGYFEVSKKNGKSTLFSGLSLYLLAGDGEPGAEVYSAAVDRDQASIVFNEAANMVEVSPQLCARLNVIRSTKRIVMPRSRSFYKALSADVSAKEGLNAHAVLVDELHAQKTRQLWDTLRYAGASRRQPLHLSVTTAGFDRHSICWEQHDYAQKVLDGTIQDSSFLAFIAAAGAEEDWTNAEVWRRANPSFGITVSAEQFAEDCREAQESPAKENSFRRYRLNQWTEQEVRWVNMEKGDAWASLCPADGTVERWEAIGRLLRPLPDDKFTPWQSYTDVVEWLGKFRPAGLVGCPDPVLAAAVQIGCEVADESIPVWLWRLHELADEELQGVVDECQDAVLAEAGGPSGA